MFLDLFMCPFLFYKCSNAIFKDSVDFNTEECFPVSSSQGEIHLIHLTLVLDWYSV